MAKKRTSKKTNQTNSLNELVRQYDKSGHRSDIHTIKNFNPADYTIMGYFDLTSPFKRLNNFLSSKVFVDTDRSILAEAIKQQQKLYSNAEKEWKQTKAELFKNRSNYRIFCDHCGQQNVSFVCALEHNQTKERIAVGWACAEHKLGLTIDQYKIKYIRNKVFQMRKEITENIAKMQFSIDFPLCSSYLNEELKYVPKYYDYRSYKRYKKYGFINKYEAAIIESKLKKWMEFEVARQQEVANTASQTRVVGQLEEATQKTPPSKPITNILTQKHETVSGTVIKVEEKYSSYGQYYSATVNVKEYDINVWLVLPKEYKSMKIDEIKSKILNKTFDIEAIFSMGNSYKYKNFPAVVFANKLKSFVCKDMN
jgi:hypothetical protein